MLKRLLLLALLIPPPLLAEGPWTVTSQEWARPRQGESLLQMPALRTAVQYWYEHGGRLQIRYPGGDAGSLWASELRAWLVALGLPSSGIELLPGGIESGRLELHHLPNADGTS